MFSPPVKRVTPEQKTHNYRKVVRSLLLIFLGLFLTIFALITIGILVFSRHEFSKNIVLIPPVIDGKVNSFIFASIIAKSNNNVTLVSVPINAELSIAPKSQLLGVDPVVDQLRSAQATVQLGLLVDEVWDGNALPRALGKEELLANWKTGEDRWRSQWEWWRVRLGLSSDGTTIHQTKSLTSLADLKVGVPVGDQVHKCSLAIVNTTAKPGVASGLTQLFEKLGLVVVRVTDNQTNRPNSHLLLSEDTIACRQLQSVVEHVSPQPLDVVIDHDSAESYRAAAVFFIGEGTANLRESW